MWQVVGLSICFVGYSSEKLFYFFEIQADYIQNDPLYDIIAYQS